MQVIAEKYQVIRKLGQGGCGAVYLTRHTDLNLPFAVKLITEGRDQDHQFQERFKREAQALTRLLHPHSVALRDFGYTPEGHLYMALDYCAGQDLKQLVDSEGPIDPHRALKFTEQILDVLGDAHEMGIVHRDLKPNNIMIEVTPEGEEVVKVLDFGLAKMAKQLGTAPVTLTKQGAIIGTPMYMAPEQAEGRPVSPRTDLYSLGLTVYFLMTGRVPYRGESEVQILMEQIHQYPQPMAQINPNLPDSLDQFVFRAIDKDPDRRFANALEMRQMIHHLASQLPSESLPSSSPGRPQSHQMTRDQSTIDLSPSTETTSSLSPQMMAVGGLLGTALVIALYMFLGPPKDLQSKDDVPPSSHLTSKTKTHQEEIRKDPISGWIDQAHRALDERNFDRTRQLIKKINEKAPHNEHFSALLDRYKKLSHIDGKVKEAFGLLFEGEARRASGIFSALETEYRDVPDLRGAQHVLAAYKILRYLKPRGRKVFEKLEKFAPQDGDRSLWGVQRFIRKYEYELNTYKIFPYFADTFILEKLSQYYQFLLPSLEYHRHQAYQMGAEKCRGVIQERYLLSPTFTTTIAPFIWSNSIYIPYYHRKKNTPHLYHFPILHKNEDLLFPHQLKRPKLTGFTSPLQGKITGLAINWVDSRGIFLATSYGQLHHLTTTSLSDKDKLNGPMVMTNRLQGTWGDFVDNLRDSTDLHLQMYGTVPDTFYLSSRGEIFRSSFRRLDGQKPYRIGETTRSIFHFEGQTLFVGTDRGKLHSLSAPLHILNSRFTKNWTFSGEGSIRCRPLIVDDQVYFVTTTGRLYSVAAKDGQLRWETKLPGSYPISKDRPHTSSPVLWRRPLGRPNHEGIVDFSPTHLCLGGPKNQFYLIEGKTGKIVWKTPTEGRIAAAPLVCGDYAFAGDTTGNLYCFDLKKHQVRWTVKVGKPIYQPVIMVGRHLVYVAEGEMGVVE